MNCAHSARDSAPYDAKCVGLGVCLLFSALPLSDSAQSVKAGNESDAEDVPEPGKVA